MTRAALAMRIYDTHCHLGLDDGGDPAAEHARAAAAAVTDLMLVGIDGASSARARTLAATLAGARWSAGLHPNDSGRFAAEWDAITALAAAPDCAAIGETGLDFFRDRASPLAQRASLVAHLDLAHVRDLPVILHCRNALPQLLGILADRAPVRGVLHCFSGTAADAEQAVALGLYVSFAAPLTYPNSAALRAAAAAVREDRLLVETDAPFLPPQSRRGARNEPAFLRETLAVLAAVRGWDLDQAAAVTYGNAVALFGPGPGT
jgi:TatD DNase family protein